MGIALARPVLVTIIGGTTPTTKAAGLGDTFKHDPRAFGEQPISASRRFWLEVRAGRRWGPMRPAIGVVAYVVALVVEYKDLADMAKLDEAIAADYEAISLRLTEQMLWDRPTSSIRCIGADSDSAANTPLLPFEIDNLAGGRRLRVLFPLELTTS